MATTSAIIDRLLKRYKDPNQEVVTRAEWLSYVQDAYDEGNAATPFWPWLGTRSTLATITPPANSVALPADVYGVTAVHNLTDAYPLHQLEGTMAYRDQFPDGADSTGSPTNYRFTGATLEVWPYPDVPVSLSVDYRAYPAALADTATTNVWPSVFHNALIEGALARAYRDDGNEAWAMAHQANFERQVAGMLSAMLQPSGDSYPLVLDNWDA